MFSNNSAPAANKAALPSVPKADAEVKTPAPEAPKNTLAAAIVPTAFEELKSLGPRRDASAYIVEAESGRATRG